MTEPPVDENEEPMRKVMELWVATPSKVRLAVFFRENPGVVETLEGLASRLAMPTSEIGSEIRDHIELGILRERNVGEMKVYALDRARVEELQNMLDMYAQTKGGHPE